MFIGTELDFTAAVLAMVNNPANREANPEYGENSYSVYAPPNTDTIACRSYTFNLGANNAIAGPTNVVVPNQ